MRFAKDILPYLNQLTGEFTQYKLANVSGMKSGYGIRLYELLIQWRQAGEREFAINDLRTMFCIKKNQYGQMHNLKARVIMPAVNDINEHSDIWVKLGQRKTGRKVTHFQFQFGEKRREQSKVEVLQEKTEKLDWKVKKDQKQQVIDKINDLMDTDY